MKILFVSHQAHYVYGGEVVSLAFLRELGCKNKFHMEFASPPGVYQERARLLVPVHEIPTVEFRRSFARLPKFIFSWLCSFFALKKIIRTREIDLAHANTLKAMVYVWPLGFLGIVPVIWHHHDILPEGAANRAWLRLLSCAAKFIVTPSEATRAALLRAGVAGDKIITIWNGFPPAEWRMRNHLVTGKKFTIGFVGELSSRKGADTVLEVARRLEAEAPGRFQWRIIGAALSQPDFAAKLQSVAQDLVGAGSVVFLGRRENIAEELQSMDLLLVPSRQDPFPTVVLEAAFSGVPVLASRVGGIPEMLRHGESGFFADTIEEFAARIQELEKNRGEWRRMGISARLFAEANFSVAGMAEKLCALYERSKS